MKAFPTQKMRETQMKISLMNSIHKTSNVLIFFPNEMESFLSEKENLETINAIHVNIRSFFEKF